VVSDVINPLDATHFFPSERPVQVQRQKPAARKSRSNATPTATPSEPYVRLSLAYLALFIDASFAQRGPFEAREEQALRRMSRALCSLYTPPHRFQVTIA
jgi:hypothetical protein